LDALQYRKPSNKTPVLSNDGSPVTAGFPCSLPCLPCIAFPKLILPLYEPFHLLVILLLSVVVLLLGSLGLLSPGTTGAASAEWRGKGEVNVLLGVETDDERGNVDHLLADTDVALVDEATSVVDGLGETELVDAGLEAALQEIFDLEGKDVIELHAGLVKDTDTDQTANEGIAFEESLGVLLVEGKELTVQRDAN
jgi:hypothetical protein